MKKGAQAASGNGAGTAAGGAKKAPSKSPGPAGKKSSTLQSSTGGGGEKHRATPKASPASSEKTTPSSSSKKKRHENSPAGASPGAFSFHPPSSSSPSPSKSHNLRSPVPFVFSASPSSSSSGGSSGGGPAAFVGIKFVPASSSSSSSSASPSASPSRGPSPSPSSSPYKGRGGGGVGRGRGGYGGGEGFDGGGGGGRGRGGGTSPYQPKGRGGGGYKPLGNSGGQFRHKQRERVLGQWSDAVNYDRVKKVINVYLNEFQLKDRDLERFIVWFESADGGRRSLGWLLNMHAKGWDEDMADCNDEQTKDDTVTKPRGKGEGAASADRQESASATKPPGMNWHLQENQITDEGVKLLIAFAKRVDSKVELRRFYLYKNIIGDDGAAAIASFVRESRSFVFEIHLSHNRLTIKGAQELFMATKEARVKPPRPLWLRLEWNYVSFEKAKKFLQDQGISYCRVKDRLQCAPSKCARKPPPLLHLYVAELQYSESVGASSHLQMAKARVKLAKEQVEKLNSTEDRQPFAGDRKDSDSAAPAPAATANKPAEVSFADTADKAKPKSAVESTGERKEAAARSTAARTPSRKTDETVAGTPTDSSAKIPVGGSDEDLLRDVPTYIFLDTCAVLRMSEWRKGAKNIESDMAQFRNVEADEEEYEDIDSDLDDEEDDEEMAADAVMKIVQRKVANINLTSKSKKSVVQQQQQQRQHQHQQLRGQSKNVATNARGNPGPEFPVFTFENLVERAKKGKFGENSAHPGDQVTLIITDTVMRELDHLKSSKPALIRNILSLQSDDGYLAKGVHLKFVEMLGAHQGEHLVALQDSSIVQSFGRKVMKGTSSLDNDRKIIDVALFWNSEIGVTGNVILLTADEGVREAAKRHNLPSDLWKNLDKRLFNALKNDPSTPWTASLLKSCMPGCMVKRDGKTMHLTPSVKPVQSIFQELDNALVLTYMLMEKMKALQSDNQRLKDFIFNDINSHVGAIADGAASASDSKSGLADLQAVIAQCQHEVEEGGYDDDEAAKLVAVTRERRRIWIETLGQMAGPMSPLRIKSAEAIWDGVKSTGRGASGPELSQLMKTAEFLEVEDDDDDDEEGEEDGEVEIEVEPDHEGQGHELETAEEEDGGEEGDDADEIVEVITPRKENEATVESSVDPAAVQHEDSSSEVDMNAASGNDEQEVAVATVEAATTEQDASAASSAADAIPIRVQQEERAEHSQEESPNKQLPTCSASSPQEAPTAGPSSECP